MDMKCKNCGQSVEESDLYCRYCGCPVPKKKEEPKLSKRQIEDQIQEAKTVLAEDDVLNAPVWDYSALKLLKRGPVTARRMRALVFSMLCLLTALGGFVGAFVLKSVKVIAQTGQLGVFIGVFALIVVGFFFLALALEQFNNVLAYQSLREKQIVIRKYGFKKPAEFLLCGIVFEMQTLVPCPACSGELIGDLHIEKIGGRFAVICNMNRRHLWYINEAEFFESLSKSDGSHESADQTSDQASGKTRD